MKSHTVPAQRALSIIQQVSQDFDVSGDYKFVVRVKDGVVHVGRTWGECFECDAHEELLERRERERYAH